MKNLIKKTVVFVNNNGWTLFVLWGWIFTIAMCFLPENITSFLEPLLVFSALAIVISFLAIAYAVAGACIDLWDKIVEKCKE